MKVHINIGNVVGISVFGALYIVLIVFKLLGVAPIIAISWWWLILWPLGLVVAVLGLFAFGLALLMGFLAYMGNERWRK